MSARTLIHHLVLSLLCLVLFTGRLWSQADGTWTHFRGSDLSGISIFEEAQFRGVRAADRALERVSGPG